MYYAGNTYRETKLTFPRARILESFILESLQPSLHVYSLHLTSILPSKATDRDSQPVWALSAAGCSASGSGLGGKTRKEKILHEA